MFSGRWRYRTLVSSEQIVDVEGRPLAPHAGFGAMTAVEAETKETDTVASGDKGGEPEAAIQPTQGETTVMEVDTSEPVARANGDDKPGLSKEAVSFTCGDSL